MYNLYPRVTKQVTQLLTTGKLIALCGSTGCGKTTFAEMIARDNNIKPFYIDASVKKSLKSILSEVENVQSNMFSKRCIFFTEFDIFFEDLFPVNQLFETLTNHSCSIIVEIHYNNIAKIQRVVPTITVVNLQEYLPSKNTLIDVLKKYNHDENAGNKVKDIKEYINICYPDVSKMKCSLKTKLQNVELYEDNSIENVMKQLYSHLDVSKVILTAQSNSFMIPPIIHENYISSTVHSKKVAEMLSIGDLIHTRMYYEQEMELLEPYLSISVASTMALMHNTDEIIHNSSYISKFSNLSTKHSTIHRLCDILNCTTLCQLHLQYKLAKKLKHKKNVTMSLKRLCEVQI